MMQVLRKPSEFLPTLNYVEPDMKAQHWKFW